MGLGAFPGTHPLYVGMPGMHGTYFANMAISHCDLLICIGARFDDRVTGNIDTFAANAKIIHIDVDPSSINKNIVVDLPIVSDAKSALENINRLLKDNNYTATDAERKDWLDQIESWKKKAPLSYCQDGKIIKPQCVIETLYEVTKARPSSPPKWARTRCGPPSSTSTTTPTPSSPRAGSGRWVTACRRPSA